ncbi:MAG: YvcK family protein [Cytophagales bacterium]|nr:YvcK family protein [Armatimonadota bacterium]
MATVTKSTLPAGSRRRRGVRIIHGLKWLTPGLRVKRWLLLIPIGLTPVLLGVIILMQLQAMNLFDWLDALAKNTFRLKLDLPQVFVPLGSGLILLGLCIMFASAVGVVRNIVSVVSPEQELYDLPDVIQKKRSLSQGPRIVVIGGGTGLSTLLRGLKRHTANLTAVVTMTDDGGSSGLLQRQMAGGMLPPGDIRNCLVALADAEPLMQELFQYRFETKDDTDGLSGHSFGNLLIAAMADITGDFEQAIEKTSSILAIRGRVLPSTVESVMLVGEMADGREVTGETSIAHDPAAIQHIKLCPDAPKPPLEVIEAIRTADVIVMGPGSVFTSVIPNLLVREIAQAIATSRAPKVYVCNVMTQPGETDGFAASDHVRAIEEHAQRHPLPDGQQRVMDFVLVNTARPSDEELLARYKKTGSQFVEPDVAEIAAMGYKPITGSFISESAVVRHDPEKLAKAILRVWSDRPFFGKQRQS